MQSLCFTILRKPLKSRRDFFKNLANLGGCAILEKKSRNNFCLRSCIKIANESANQVVVSLGSKMEKDKNQREFLLSADGHPGSELHFSVQDIMANREVFISLPGKR